MPPTPTATVAPTPTATPSSNTLYSDDFEADAIGAVPAGWSIEAGSSWSVQQNGSHALEQTSASTSTLYGISTGSPTWTDYTVAASVQPGAGSDVSGTSVVAIEGRRQDVNNFYSLLIKNGSEWYLGYKLNGNWSTLANGTMSYTTTTWYNWTLTMTGTTISASINGVTLATVKDSTFSAGNIAFKTRNQSAFDNVLVTATGTVTPTPTPTASATPGGTPTVTATATATSTATPAPTATATPFGNGSISGHVTNASNGAALVGATVTTVPASVTTTTNSQGNYTLQNIAANTYDVVVKMSGYNANHAPNVVVSNSTTTTANVALAGVPAYTAMDNYTQPNQSGWNPSTDGNTWTDDASAYPGAAVSINNNLGYVDTYTAATDRDEWMGPYYADQLVSADFNVGQYGQDSYQHGARLLGRVQDGNNFIDFAINYATSTLQIWVNSNNNWTMMSQVNVPAFKTNQWYHAQLLTVGNMSYGKVWAYGAADPGWQISGSQNSLSTGAGGNRSTYCDINWANYSYQAVTTITGVVTNTSGSAIAGATVSDGTHSVTTDSSGRYVLIEPNTNGTYTVTASASGYSSKSASASTTSLKSTTLNMTL